MADKPLLTPTPKEDRDWLIEEINKRKRKKLGIKTDAYAARNSKRAHSAQKKTS